MNDREMTTSNSLGDPARGMVEDSRAARDPMASKNKRMADKAHVPVIVLNYIADPSYAPYCGRCTGLHRMTLVEPFLWGHGCGAVHDERQVLT